MAWLNEQAGLEIKAELTEIAVEAFKNASKVKPRALGLMTQKEVMDELNVTHTTIRRWERAGLRRYTPPIEGAKAVFYRVSDVLVFLGVENG
ncbi:MerR family transcriptional regulator [uncultured Streptococcus sp.]|uniref:helix-turn-helix transcriptional regulator n=1 Tax=uncultured Streptococcus sp. TaxID=83427 RepID=UPI0027DCB6DC|nr:MerR family transcriptional regulator [uncultured Streptococcus sp.]